VCQLCISHFRIKEVIDSRTYDQTTYLLVMVSHSSPIHLTWIQEKSMNESLRPQGEDNTVILVSSEPEVEVVLSMHVPMIYANYKI
jgi:hypothetical protein